MAQHIAPDAPVTTLRNIGPAFAEALARAGIHSAQDLRAIGADDTYRKLLATGSRPHFISFYVLHMALQNRLWNDCKGAEKAALRERFDAIVAETAGRSDLERALDAIGVGLRR
ncbi:MAG: TfoX/Sxy family protein [Pseudomonadota bacterium]